MVTEESGFSTNTLAIREAIFVRLQTLVGYAKCRKILTPQLQPDDLPAISCGIISEDFTSDGDENAGEARYIDDSVIGISVARGFKDPLVLDGRIDLDITDIQDKLIRDPTFFRLGPDALFESIPRIARRRVYPFDGETYFLELRLEMTFRSRPYFEPLITSPFAGITMETAPFGSSASTPRVYTDIPVSQE